MFVHKQQNNLIKLRLPDVKASLEYQSKARPLPKLNVYYSKPELAKPNAIRVESKIIPIAH